MSDAAAKQPGGARQLECPNCGGVIEVRANGISISAVCGSCGSTIDVASPDLKVIAEARARTREPTIAIGKRGTLAGTEWEVVGFQTRSNPAEGWSWDEYLLFNPYRGFRFLAHDDEGWTLFGMLRQDVPDPKRGIGDNRRYTGPEVSQARTDYVLGEFYWRARVGDVAEVAQYDANPYVLVQERTGEEIIWSRGVKVAAPTVQRAFALEKLPEQVAAASDRQKTVRVLRTAAAALLLLFVLHAMSFGASRSVLVFRQEYRVTAADRGRPLVSPPITVPDASGNLRIGIEAPVQNDWLDLTLSLVSEPGGRSFVGSRTVEYYSGREEDGTWTEGSQRESVLFASIPGGTYRLLIDADAGAFGKPPARSATPVQAPAVPFTIEMRRHVPAPELFWIALLLLIPYPAYRLLFRRGT